MGGGVSRQLAARVRLRGEFGQFDARRRLPALLAMFGDHVGENAAAHVEARRQAHETRLDGLDQVVEDAVGDILVKMSLVAKTPDVELQAFQFDAQLVREVIERQHREVRLAGLGAQAGELGDLHVDVEIPPGSGVREGIEGFGRLCAHGRPACCL